MTIGNTLTISLKRAAKKTFLTLSFIALSLVSHAAEPVHEEAVSLSRAKSLSPTASFMYISMKPSFMAGLSVRGEFDFWAAIRAFYAKRKNRPYWMKNYGHHEHALILISRLENAWTHGLRPQDYYVDQIKRLLDEDGYQQKAQLELLLTVAFVKYAADLTGFRFAPAKMQINSDHWRQPMSPMELLDILTSHRDFMDTLSVIEPQGRTYKALREEYLRLVRLEQGVPNSKPWKPITFEKLLSPEDEHESVPRLRERLDVEQPRRGKYVYDDFLVEAVKDFQEDHGLEADGKIGKITLQFLNRTRQDKIRQLLVNMERYRWMEGVRPDKFILVNIPNGKLWAIENGRVVHEMPTIVGKLARKTPVFRTEITGVRFNPDWTVPPTIKRFDVVPAIRRNVGYLEKKGMTLLTGYGEAVQTVDPESIDWKSATMRDLQHVRIVQKPGDHNPLGRIRILMPNKFNIYLHDTNHPEYFDRTVRQLSSGCMRMKYPEKIAQFVMDGEQGWDEDMVEEHLAHLEKTDLSVSRSIPSYTLYYTAWIGDDGAIVYGPDVYGYDRPMYRMMQERGLTYDTYSIMTGERYSDANYSNKAVIN